MRTLTTDATADQLPDYLASDGAGGERSYFAALGEWQSLYNLCDERHFVSRLARNLVGRELGEIRRAALGMQLRLTPAGIDLAGQRERQSASAAAETDWAGIADALSA